MGTLSRAVNFYIDGNRSGGEDARLDGKLSSKPSSVMTIMSGDRCALNLYFRQRDSKNGASTAFDLATGSTLVVSGRKSTGDQLFKTSEFVAYDAGTDNSRWTGILDLGATVIKTALASTEYGGFVTVYIDIEVRDANNTERLSYRITANLYKQVHSETAPIPSSLAASYLQSPDGSTWRVTIDDEGQPRVSEISIDEQDPDFIMLQAANFQSPGGYFWEMTIDDNGQMALRRIQ